MPKFIALATAVSVALPALSAQGRTLLGTNPALVPQNTIVTQGGPGGPSAPGNPDDARYNATFGRFAGVDGVVSLLIRTPVGNFGCTGTLLNNRRQILTAAHCLTNEVGNPALFATSVDVRFQGPSNTFERTITVPASGMRIHPGYTGLVVADNDLAVLDLPTEAPTFARGVGIFNGPASAVLGQQITFVGYGSTGTGTTGDGQGGFAFRRRFGFNRLESTCSAIGATPASNDCGFDATPNGNRGIFLSDFDNGSPLTDTMCVLYQPTTNPLVCNRGVTGDILDEVGVGRGDSGGPALFNGLIAGVASWGTGGSLNPGAFGAWGALYGHVNVTLASNQAWLNLVAPGAVVPEPSTYALMATGLAGLAAIARRRRTPKA